MTEHNEEVAQAAVVADQAAQKSRGLRARLDPGWATITAATLALIGTVVTAVVHNSGGGSQQVVAGVSTTVGEAARSGAANTEPASTTTLAPTTTVEQTTSTSSTSLVTTTTVPPGPVVQLMSALPNDQRQATSAAAASILQLANQLPLIVHDEFANNDYAWPVTEQTYSGGIQCSWAIKDRAYQTLIHTEDGGAWCRNGLEKEAADFVLTVDEQLRDNSNSDIGLQFRMTPERTTYYELSYNPQTQTLSLSFVDPTGVSPIIPQVYVASIDRDAPNTLTLLALGPSLAVYVNNSLAALVSNETRLTGAGTIGIRVQLNEAHEDELLSLTRYELRGS